MDNNTYSLIIKTNIVLIVIIGLYICAKQENLYSKLVEYKHENKKLKKELAKMEKCLEQAKNGL